MLRVLSWLTLSCFAAGQATDTAQDLLARVEKELNKADKQYHVFEITVRKRYPTPGESRGFSKTTVVLHTDGSRRLFQWMAPPDLAGTKILSLSPTQTYVYLPAFAKVRRLADNNHLPFAGVSLEDFYANFGSYVAEYASESPRRLVLTPKEGVKTTYSRIDMEIAPDRDVLYTVKFFIGDFLVKTESRSDYECEDKNYPQGVVCMPAKIVLERLDSIVQIKDLVWDSNVPLPGKLFTREGLEVVATPDSDSAWRKLIEESKTRFRRLRKKAEEDGTGSRYWTAIPIISGTTECTINDSSGRYMCHTAALPAATRRSTLSRFEEAIRAAVPSTWISWQGEASQEIRSMTNFGPDKEHPLIAVWDSSPNIFISVQDYAGWH